MYKLYAFVVLFFASCNSSQKTIEPTNSNTIDVVSPVEYGVSITEDELKEHLYIYASDEFEGRETGSFGQKKAVAYLIEQYKKMGIKGALPRNSFEQKVPVEIAEVPTGKIVINGDAYTIGEAFLSFSTIEGQFNKVISVNYGIDSEQYSDYKNINVEDKVVFMRFGEPKNSDGTYLITGSHQRSFWSNFNESLSERLSIATKKGAKAILLYDENNYSRLKSRFEYLAKKGNARMTLAGEKSKETPSIFLGPELGQRFEKALANKKVSKSIRLNLEFAIKDGNEPIDTENIVAYVRGSEKPNEYVVISSHLDHIGLTESGEVNNGADDDGSGTVALLEIAEAFKMAAKDGNGPKRSVVFLHFTAEEKGLFGSQYYCDTDPVFPLKQTVANLNIDMIGRTDPKRVGPKEYIYLIGADRLSNELHQISEDVNAKYAKLELDYKYNDENDPSRFYYRSDHYNFAKNNIPVIFYFNGVHPDYHQPGDTPDKIEYDLLKRRTSLVFYTAWELANRKERLRLN